MEEVWKEIADNDSYEVSNMGNVRNTRTKDCIYQSVNTKGYRAVSLWKNNTRHSYRVHRLVAEHFIPNPDGLPQVDHISRDKNDNRVHNLRWASQECNSWNRGLFKTNKTGQQYINMNGTGFLVGIKRNGQFILRKTFKSLDEAIQARDACLAAFEAAQ